MAKDELAYELCMLRTVNKMLTLSHWTLNNRVPRDIIRS